MTLLPMLYSLLVFHAQAAELPKVCYDTIDASQFCTTDNLGKVQVFVYNAGWCGPCNEEMAELGPSYSQFVGKKVVFASLSGEGYSHGARPDKVFLESWKKKHKIPFVVAGKYKDFGGVFGSPGYIPFSVIIDSKGNIAKKGSLSTNEIAAKVTELVKDVEQDVVLSKTFFEKIRGNYVVESVAGHPPHDPNNLASVYWDAEFPNLEMVYIPYCVAEVCMDSGNYFVYDNTTVTKTEKGYHIVLKSEGNDLQYDWEEDATGKIIYRNYQFKGQSDIPMVLEHVLRKKLD